MGSYTIVTLLFLLVCVLPAIGQKLSKERMTEYFQYANVNENDIEDLVTSVNSYSKIGKRSHAAKTWVNNRISEGTEDYAKNISTFVRSLHKADGFMARLMFTVLYNTDFVPQTKVEELRQQYYNSQEKLYGNDMLYSLTELYTNTMEMLDFDETRMDDFDKQGKEVLTRIPIPDYMSDDGIWESYKVLKWPKLYLNINMTYSPEDSKRDRTFKKMLENFSFM